MSKKTLTPLQQKFKDNPKSKRQIEAVFEYNKAERKEVDLRMIQRVLADRWLICQDYDFTNLQTYIDTLAHPDHNLEEFGMAYIRLDDLTEIFRLANETVVREWSDEQDAQEQDEYEAQLDHGSEIIKQISSVSWNLNRIATQLETGSKSRSTETTDIHERLMRKNTINLLRGKS